MVEAMLWGTRHDPDELVNGYVPPGPESVPGILSPTHSHACYIFLTDLRKAIMRHANGISGRVLDYGCGGKPYAKLFSHASDYVGADFPNNHYADICLDSEGRLPRSLNGFDAVVSSQVLHAVPDISLYLSECRRVLVQRAGKLLLTAPGIWEYCPGPRDLYRWTHEGLVHMMEQHGFETCHVEPVTTGLRAILQILLRSILRHRLASGWPRPMRLLCWVCNYLADCLRDELDLRRSLYDFPISYLYLGKVSA
jgi:SAM-dependent methyltransferase